MYSIYNSKDIDRKKIIHLINQNNIKYNEKSIPQPSDFYGKSKLESENILIEQCKKNNISYFDLRLFKRIMVYTKPYIKTYYVVLISAILFLIVFWLKIDMEAL